MQRDPIQLMQQTLTDAKIITEKAVKEMDKHEREVMIDSMKYAEESPWPEIATLEEDVFAP
jgi:pyruvate dehydrogenase E1 component alpha subunit